MINNKKIIAIITARGGSKSLKNKNIMILDGHPLVSWSIREAKKSKYIDKLILSTDDRKIIKIAENYGCEIPFKRPKYLSTDKLSKKFLCADPNSLNVNEPISSEILFARKSRSNTLRDGNFTKPFSSSCSSLESISCQ